MLLLQPCTVNMKLVALLILTREINEHLLIAIK